MSGPVRTPARSLHGCWTCRVRRKKCDETHPGCNTCGALHLKCFGYGPRPEWMDNGVLQKQQAAVFKHAVTQARAERVLQKICPPSNSVPHSSLPDTLDSLRTWHSASTSSPSLPASVAPHGPSSHPESRATPPPQAMLTHTPCSPSSHHGSLLAASDLLGWETYTPAKTFAKCLNSDPDGLFPVWPPDSHHPPRPSASASLDHHLGWNDLLSQEDGGVPGMDFTCGYFDQTPEIHWESATSETLSTASLPTPAPPNDSAEDTLFMHYLDQTFYVQYPFHRSLAWQGRGWLLSIVGHDRPAYYATLALSKCHLLSTSPCKIRSVVDADGGYYEKAMRAMQDYINMLPPWNADDRLSHSLYGLASINQLMFYQVFAGRTHSWHHLFRQANILLPVIVQGLRPQSPAMANPSEESQGLVIQTPPHVETGASGFLLSSFVALDILFCASTRLPTTLNLNHLQVLSNSSICFEQLMGYRSSIMAMVFEISQLDQWKKAAQSAHKLSMVELVKRSDHIEQRLWRELADVQKTPSPTESCSSTGNRPTPVPPAVVDQLFTLSAITYLHVVVSGAHPELPEIARSVALTVRLFKELKEPGLIKGVAWPFCVTGCLANEEQQSTLRNLMSAAGISRGTIVASYEAFVIMEECWERRKTYNSPCDWATMMNERGRPILL